MKLSSASMKFSSPAHSISSVSTAPWSPAASNLQNPLLSLDSKECARSGKGIPEKPPSSNESSVPETSSISAVFANTLKSVFGTGVLTMPYAFAQSGIIPGVAMTLVIAAWSFYTQNLIAQCCYKVSRSRDVRTYDDIAEFTLGRFGKTIGTINIFLNQILVTVSYVIFVATNISCVAGLSSDPSVYPHWLILAMFPIFAVFACLRDISTISVVSAIGNVFLMVSLVVIMGAAWPEVSWAEWEAAPSWGMSGLVAFFGLTSNAFAGHAEAVPIFLSMKQKSKYAPILSGVAVFAVAMQGGLGVFLFSAFGANTQPIVFNNLSGIVANVAKLAMAMVIYLTMPLKLFPAIVIVESRVFKKAEKSKEKDPQSRLDFSPPPIKEDDPCSPTSSLSSLPSPSSTCTPPSTSNGAADAETPRQDVQTQMPSDFLFVTDPKQILVRALLAFLPMSIALTGVNFAVLLEFVGAFCVGTFAFALPPIMHLILFWKVEDADVQSSLSGGRLAFHVVLAIIGVSVAVFSSTQVVLQNLS